MDDTRFRVTENVHSLRSRFSVHGLGSRAVQTTEGVDGGGGGGGGGEVPLDLILLNLIFDPLDLTSFDLAEASLCGRLVQPNT